MQRSIDATGRRGFTVVEILIALALFSIVIVYLAQTFIFATRAEQSTSKKLISARTLQILQGRIRRDAKATHFAKAIDSGAGITFADDRAFRIGCRTYRWDAGTKVLTTPDLTHPVGTAVPYGQTRFRMVEFTVTPDGSAYRALLSPLDWGEREGLGNATAQERQLLWGAATVGTAQMDDAVVPAEMPLYNDPTFALLTAP